MGARAKKSRAPGPPHGVGVPWAPSKKKSRKKQENEAKNKEKTRKSKKNTGNHRLQRPWRAPVMTLGYLAPWGRYYSVSDKLSSLYDSPALVRPELGRN